MGKGTTTPWRRAALLLMAALLLLTTACTPKPPQPPDGGPGPGPSDKPGQPISEVLPIEPAPDALQHETYPKGQAFDGVGIFFMKVATGEVDHWRLKNRWGRCAPSWRTGAIRSRLASANSNGARSWG